jgi:IclR family mhp operon transcriptional activator
MAKSGTVQSALRALRVIEVLNRRRVTSLEVLHGRTSLPKATLVRLLETLISAGYVFRVSRREGYALTEQVLQLSAGVRHRDVIVDVARPLMEAFTRQHKWQVSLSTSERDCMLVRATTRHISPFAREEIYLNRRVPILRSAIGRAYLAFCSAEERAAILNILADADPTEIAETGGPAKVDAMMRRVRRDGYATIVRPPEDPSRSFAVPILEPDAPESPLGSVVMFWYRSAMTEAEAIERYLGHMQTLAEAVASGLTHARDLGSGAQPAGV